LKPTTERIRNPEYLNGKAKRRSSKARPHGKDVFPTSSEDMPEELLEYLDTQHEKIHHERLLGMCLKAYGKQLNLLTPDDGHCLFHALREGGLLGELADEITVENLRSLALGGCR